MFEKDANKTMQAIINPISSKTEKCITNILKINIKALQI